MMFVSFSSDNSTQTREKYAINDTIIILRPCYSTGVKIIYHKFTVKEY